MNMNNKNIRDEKEDFDDEKKISIREEFEF